MRPCFPERGGLDAAATQEIPPGLPGPAQIHRDDVAGGSVLLGIGAKGGDQKTTGREGATSRQPPLVPGQSASEGMPPALSGVSLLGVEPTTFEGSPDSVVVVEFLASHCVPFDST